MRVHRTTPPICLALVAAVVKRVSEQRELFVRLRRELGNGVEQPLALAVASGVFQEHDRRDVGRVDPEQKSVLEIVELRIRQVAVTHVMP